MTGAHRSGRAARAVLWLPGLAVALGAAAATAHGLYEVALAAAVPVGHRLALPADHGRPGTRRLRRDGPAVRLGGPLRLGGGRRRGRALRAGAGRVPRLRRDPRRLAGAAVRDRGVARRRGGCRRAPALPPGQRRPPESDDGHRSAAVQPSSRPIRATGGSEPRRPSNAAPRPTPASRAADAPPPTSAQNRARAAALRHAARHGALPTVSALAAAADVSRGTAATVLKPLRGRPLPLHLINTNPDDDTIEEHNQP